MKKLAPCLSFTAISILAACSASLDVRTAGEGSETGIVYALPMNIPPEIQRVKLHEVSNLDHVLIQ